MKAQIVFVSLLLGLSTSAFAADETPSDDTIVHSIQCEAGRVGQRLIALKGFPADLKVMVSWKSTKTTDGSAGGGFKLPFFSIGASADLAHQDLEELNSDGLAFNLHADNIQVCRGYKKEIITEGVGVYDCLIEKKLASLRVAVEGGTGSAGCRHQVTLTKKLSGSFRLNVWGVDLGPQASWGDSFVYNFIIAAPPPKK